MATTVTSGTYSVDSTGAIALESSAGEIVIGDDSVNQAIKVGTHGTRTVTVGNAAANVNVRAHTADVTFGTSSAGALTVKDYNSAEMTKLTGSLGGTSQFAMRADFFLLFDGTSSSSSGIPVQSDPTRVLKISHADGTEVTDDKVTVTTSNKVAITSSGAYTSSSDRGGVEITSSHATGDIRLITSGAAATNSILMCADAACTAGAWSLTTRAHVGINQASPTQALQIGASGDGSYALANGWNTFSDARLKKNVTSLEPVLDAVLRLRPVTYDWRSSSAKDSGLLAQELRDSLPLPGLVHEGTDGMLSVDYSKISVVAIKAIQEQQQLIEEQREQLIQQQRELKAAKADLEDVRNKVSSLESMMARVLKEQ